MKLRPLARARESNRLRCTRRSKDSTLHSSITSRRSMVSRHPRQRCNASFGSRRQPYIKWCLALSPSGSSHERLENLALSSCWLNEQNFRTLSRRWRGWRLTSKCTSRANDARRPDCPPPRSGQPAGNLGVMHSETRVMSDRTHQCVNQPTSVWIERDSGYFGKDKSWVLVVARLATERDLEENHHLEEVGEAIWSTVVEVSHCPYCGICLGEIQCGEAEIVHFDHSTVSA